MKQENYRLIKMAQSGDREALERLIEQNVGLIWNAVRKFGGRGTENDDLFQLGAIGLIKAVNKFDTSFNVEFSTYAVPMIIGEIRRFLRDDGMIKVSRTLKETATKANQAAEKIAAEKGREATISEIAEMLNINSCDVTLAFEATQTHDSIYRTVYDSGGAPVLLMDKLENEDSCEENILNSVALNEAIKKLPQRERQILLLRYYKEKTQSEVARIMGLSQVQISRIEKKLLCSLQKNIG